MENDLNNIKSELSVTEYEIEQLNEDITFYSDMLNENSKISEENENLKCIQEINQKTILNYKNEIKSLEFEIILNNEIISKLKSENQELKIKKSEDNINKDKNQISNKIDKTENNGINKNNINQYNKNELNNIPIPEKENKTYNLINENNKNEKNNIINKTNKYNEINMNELLKIFKDRELCEYVLSKYSKDELFYLLHSYNDKEKDGINKEIIKKIEVEYNEKKKNNNNIINIKDIEEIEKKKSNYEQKFSKIKEKCNHIRQDIEQRKLIRDNHKKHLNEINEQIILYNERNDISVNNSKENKINNTDKKVNIEDLHKQVDIISNIIIKLDDIFFNLINIFGENIEYTLNDIQKDLNNISKKEYKNENNLKNMSKNIENNINEIEDICSIYEENKNNFDNENKKIEEETNKLNQKLNIIKKKKEKGKNENNENYNLCPINENKIENIRLDQSFLFGLKKEIDKEQLKINSQNREEDYIENYIEEQTIIRKNWKETCYIYDDYDIHDIYYDIKAVGLDELLYFDKCSHIFNYDSIIEIKSLHVNEIPTNYIYINIVNSIVFNIKLYNLETAKVHIIYKESKDLSKLNQGEIEQRNIYKEEYYGLGTILAGQIAEYTLILKGNFDIVDFSEYFLIKNKDNLNETEYLWRGIVPFEGKNTIITISKKEAIWSFNVSSKINSDKNIRCALLIKSMEFIGGNNEIIKMNISSPQTNNIITDEIRRNYVVIFKNIEKEGEFIIKGEFKNKSKGEWICSLTDEEIENLMPMEDKLCKPQLAEIAKKIIEDFDKNNKNTDFEFLDYMKIGLWVYNNIKYDYNYIGKTQFSAIDIYNMKVGVCYHFTRLSNALLYSLGYKVIKVTGLTSKKNKEFNNNISHSWSLIEINKKWYPFDSTWGIVSGKLPITHIFRNYSSYSKGNLSFDNINFGEEIITGKYLG